ncbi:MAG: DNA polymerase-3 subunit gamma/tau [Saprospiraceae bacterium]|jgi:DNA polymerase-3 subunit gamma/tau
MSKFVVSARKYRPTAFDEVVGQMHVAKTLKNALQTEQLAHAFLFCGPRGVGKTTCARILAKVINCENPKDKVDPCNECSSCMSFNDNASFNIIELDAASNNSVDHIRTLIEQVRFQPQQGTHKVFIIDEVHMLSSQAFNAFLKTLEEPPPYAIFILATTEKHKIIPTILSRCQIFDFKRIQVNDVVKQLEHICVQEGKTADPEALHLIGQKADGAMRDALSIFDKIASASGDHITYKDVIANLNILDYEYYFKIVDAFLREDLSDVLLIMDEIMRSGFEPDQLIQGLADHMRDLLVCKDGRTLGLLDVSESLKSRYQHQAALTSKSVLLTGLDILNQCDVTLPRSKNKRLYTEIALSKINFANRAIETNLLSPQGSVEKKTEVVTEPEAISATVPNSSASQQETETVPIETVQPIQNQLDNNPGGKSNIPVASNQSQVDKEEIKGNNLHATPAVPSMLSVNQTESSESGSPTTSEISAPKETSSPTTELKTKSPTDDLLAFGKPSGIDDILASVVQEEAQIEELRKGLNQETVQKLWSEYGSKHDSPSTKAMMEMSILELEDKTVHITVPSNHYKNMILEEDPLKELLRTKLGTPDLMINPIVDRSAFPDIALEKPKVLMTAKEKYQYLGEKHPSLRTLVEKLELRPDTGGEH